MSRFKIPLIEIYITNVCNLTCRGCNRFNNFKFTGHYFWNDYAAEMEQWAQRLDPETISIMGGEPTLNPELETWVANLRRLWPETHIMIQSNGTYDRPEFAHFWKKYKVGKAISLHDPETADDIAMKNTSRGLIEAFVFQQAAIIERPGYFDVHHSDPAKAFYSCGMKTSHTIHSGKLYKCPLVANLPEFQKQHKINLDARQQQVLDSYEALSADCTDADLENFVNTRDKHIPQCEFCPEVPEWQTALGEHRTGLQPPDFRPYKTKRGV